MKVLSEEKLQQMADYIMFVHPKWGTCVACGYECLGNPLGYYKAKVLKDGLKISVSFKDTSITRIN